DGDPRRDLLPSGAETRRQRADCRSREGMTAHDDRQLVAGCLLGSFIGTEAPPWLLDLVRDGLGGVLLFAQNVIDDAQVADLCQRLHETRGDLLIAIDEEGGDVTRLDAARGSDTPSPAAFGFVDDVGLTGDAYADLGSRINRLGIDVTLAPCADINSNPRNPIIGVRSFGSTADLVARHVVAAVDGFHRGGVSVAVKHFPGHGDTTADTHHHTATLRASMAELTERELVPFRAAVDAAVDALLTAHVIAEAVDEAPASLSRPWTDLLRGSMGFDGVIITDALDMDAVARGRGVAGVGDAAVDALRAGADLLCLGSNFDAAMTNVVIDHIVAALEGGQLERTELEHSRKRIAGLRPSLRPAPTPSAGAARLVADAAVCVDGPLPAGPYTVLECRPPGNMACFNVSWGVADMLRDSGWPVALVSAADPIDATVAAELAAAGDLPVLVVVRDAGTHKWQSQVIEAAANSRPTSVVAVEFGWPSADRIDGVAYVVTHGAARSSALAVLDRLGLPLDVRES
ncbi:MAG TPA: glycoside hydrolase family 3 N-terminal domain-containing protein, partial [Ilumatobacteraceae bacterium]